MSAAASARLKTSLASLWGRVGGLRAVVLVAYLVVLVSTFWLSRLGGAGRLVGGDDAAAEREAQHRSVLGEVRTLRERKPAVQGELQSLVDRTLGGSLEVVDGALRARLNRLGESEGLKGLVVGTGASSARESPARSSYGRTPELRKLRDEVDFVTLEGWINGEGSVDQVFRLLQRIEAEPWLKRVGTVRLDAVRGDRKSGGPRLKLSLVLTTIFVPGREPKAQVASTWTPKDFATLAPLTKTSLFAMPAPPAPPPTELTAAPPPPPAPPAFPYGDWTLSGVASGPSGPEVWLLNRASNERRVLLPGQALHELVLAEAGGERATFTIAGRSVVVGVGEPMREK